MVRGRAVTAAVFALAALGILAVARAGPAAAHPLGNFTVNRYARIEISAGVVRVHYVLDEAEIPAFQSRRELAAGREGFAATLAAEIASGLALSVDGRVLPLRPLDHLLTEPPGQGGLSTLRLAVSYVADLGSGAAGSVHRASFVDGNQPGRVGWREIVVVARGDATITASDVPAADTSDELRAYPDDLLSSPLDRRSAEFSFTPGVVTAGPATLTAGTARSTGGFAALVTRDTGGLPALVGLLALAVGFGAVHALGPGHGKTLMAAYLAGTRGRSRDAVALGAVVSIMHTASVLVLGLVLVQLDRSVATERVYAWLELIAGAAVIGIGLVLLARRRRRRTVTADHHHGDDHDHDDHDHDDHGDHYHDHGDHGDHDHGHGHTHELSADVAPLSVKGLVALGAAGGLFPSPSAVLVVVSAFSARRAPLGLALVGGFSVGLAATLTAVGLALVKGRTVLERHLGGRALRLAPVLGAAGLVVAGLVIAVRGVTAL
ncbi:MAG: High-affinity nickel-transporter [Acidimicrobiales bacterium]